MVVTMEERHSRQCIPKRDRSTRFLRHPLSLPFYSIPSALFTFPETPSVSSFCRLLPSSSHIFALGGIFVSSYFHTYTFCFVESCIFYPS
ncbi:hypothetical protein F5H01DRAFT_353730 [Linnemannia elongata]|nr:hypothetical protein F5H01DRAFT_353730 [Linnemannia elongata]